MADPLFISDLISKVLSGQIRIPSFQRGFVWDAERVAHLMDSIYKGYPFGTLLFWRTKTPLSTEKNLGPFILPQNDPDYPVDYILDGQQRATSIFGVFQSTLSAAPGEDDSWSKIYFDLCSNATAQESRFLPIQDSEVNNEKHFPLKILFDAPKYRQYLKSMDESIGAQVDMLYRKFTTAKIPVQTFETNEKSDVAIVFERINRMGVELDTLQLLSAWSWSDNFDLQEKFSDLSEELEPFGFNQIGEDSNLLLRCCAAILANNITPSSIIDLNGEEVRTRFNEIKNGIIGSIDFLRTNLKVPSARILPYTNIVVPLSVFFASKNEQDPHPTDTQRSTITRWVWKTFFTRRYSKRLDQINNDIKEILKLKNSLPSQLGDFNCEIDDNFFTKNTFNLNNVNAKTFILMLASERPLNFIGGGEINLNSVLMTCNKKEFHHIFPKSYLKKINIDPKNIDPLVNFCILARADNNKISGDRPSEYRKKMPEDEAIIEKILARSLCPLDMFDDNYEKFIEKRNTLLTIKAKTLIA